MFKAFHRLRGALRLREQRRTLERGQREGSDPRALEIGLQLAGLHGSLQTRGDRTLDLGEYGDDPLTNSVAVLARLHDKITEQAAVTDASLVESARVGIDVSAQACQRRQRLVAQRRVEHRRA